MSPSSALWAVTSYFNPLRYRRRRENYDVFRRHLDVPLLAVELGFEGRFEIEPGDADVVIRIEGGDVMWQKERLLNLRVAQLPGDCNAVAMIDADVVLADPRWPQAALAQLDRFPVVQLFTEVRHLAPGSRPFEAGAIVADSQRSTARVVSEAADPLAALAPVPGNNRGAHTPGFGWAFRRDLLQRHGLLDTCIVGGGDRALSAVNYGAFSAIEERMAMNAAQKARFNQWAQPWFASVRGQVGCLEGDLYHLWHGALENRRYGSRYLELARLGYNPGTDIQVGASGAWRWASDKPELHAWVVDYFAQRREDD